MIKDENNNHNMMGVKPVADVVIETGGGSGGKKDPGHTNKPSLFKLRMQGSASVTPPSTPTADVISSTLDAMQRLTLSETCSAALQEQQRAESAAPAAEREAENGTPSKLGTIKMFIRDNNRGGAASPAGKLRVCENGNIQVLTPKSKGPWGEGGDVLDLREWNSRFRKEDPVITPKKLMPMGLSLTPPPPPPSLGTSPAGPKCRFLQKHVSELDQDKHEKQLKFSATVSTRLLAVAVDALQRERRCGGAGAGGASSLPHEEDGKEKRLEELIAGSNRAALIHEYVRLMHTDGEDEEEVPREAGDDDWGLDDDGPQDCDDHQDMSNTPLLAGVVEL